MPAIVDAQQDGVIHRERGRPVEYRTVATATILVVLFFLSSTYLRSSSPDAVQHQLTPSEPIASDREARPLPLRLPNADATDSSKGEASIPNLALDDASVRKYWHRVIGESVQTDAFKQVLAEHLKACAATNPMRMNEPTTSLQFVGPTAVRLHEPGWVRLWVSALVGSGRACRGGDVIEVQAESNLDRPAVDMHLDLGNGLYEVRFFARRGGLYELCADWMVSFAAQPNRITATMGPRIAVFNDSFFTGLPTARWDRRSDKIEFPSPKSYKHCTIGRSWQNATCVKYRISVAAAGQRNFDAALTAQRQARGTKCTHPATFRSGSWVRLPRGVCDGDVCVGNLTALQSGGWVWASDWCTLTIFDPAAAWMAVGGRWIAAWGDSTLKQPLANFVEYTLRVPVFRVPMERIETAPRKKRPNFFSYRQYEVTRARPPAPNSVRTEDMASPAVLWPSPNSTNVTVSMAWGGCPQIAAPPNCNDPGMRNRAVLSASLAKHAQQEKRLPSIIIMNHYIWRVPLYSETTLVANLHETVSWLHGALRQLIAQHSLSRAAMPLLVWMTPTRRIVGASREAACTADDAVAFTAHNVLVIEHELSSHYPFEADPTTRWARPSVLLLSRYSLTCPFHYDDTFVHFGIHYGATRGMCLTGISYKDGYELQRCLRETFPDGMLIQWWLNAMNSVVW